MNAIVPGFFMDGRGVVCLVSLTSAEKLLVPVLNEHDWPFGVLASLKMDVTSEYPDEKARLLALSAALCEMFEVRAATPQEDFIKEAALLATLLYEFDGSPYSVLFSGKDNFSRTPIPCSNDLEFTTFLDANLDPMLELARTKFGVKA